MNKHIADLAAVETLLLRPAGRDAAIRFASVSKSFASASGMTQALDDVSLSVRRGEFVALVGPSGCGKTTLLNLIAGLLHAESGEVLYEGASVTGPNAQVGYLTQVDALLPWRNVLSNVALPLEIRGVARAERLAEARAIIARVGLGGFERHYPGQLSGGMRKRVAIARTLIYKPQTLLLDEPFGALDAQTRLLMQGQLQQLVHELGLTVLLVTHDIAEAIALADRIVVFSKRPARIVDVIDVPRRTEVQALVRSADPLYDRVWSLLADEIDITAAA